MRPSPSPQGKPKRGAFSPISIETSLCGGTPSHRAWTSPTDLDARGAAAAPDAHLNSAIPFSASPLAEERYAAEEGGRAAPPVEERTRKSSTSPTEPYRSAVSTVAVPPSEKKSCFVGPGTVVEERDPVTREVIAKYRCGLLLGQGGFSQVFEFIDVTTGAQYAGKVIDKRKITRSVSKAKIRLEVDIHRRMNHPNVVQFIKTFQDDFFYYIILEQCSRKSLMDISKERRTLSREEIQYIMIQIISAVEYMHRNLVIHRDLKLGNVMIDFKGNMKVGDFGLASELSSPLEKKRTMCGTPNYIAPEIIANEQGQGYGLEVDIWSLGVLLYALAFGTPPFETRDINTTYGKIRRCDYAFPAVSPVSESCKDLIRWMLQSDPLRRPTANEVLRHTFFSSPPPPRSAPETLMPTDGLRFSLAERRSPLWASPIAATSPYAYNEEPPRHRELPKALFSKEGTVSGFQARHRIGPCVTPKAKDTFAMTDLKPPLTSHTNEKNGLLSSKPPFPSFVIQSSIFCNKYGYGFLTHQEGKLVPVVYLNDKTKLLYDSVLDRVFYYSRSRVEALPESGNRSPLLSEELASKRFRDELVIFTNASEVLTYHHERVDPADRIQSAAAKKFSIAKFFLPYLKQNIKDKRMISITSVFKGWVSEYKKELFASSTDESENNGVVYVKDAVVETLYEILGEYQELGMTFLATRMSDYSFQVSIRCERCSYKPAFVPACDGLNTNQLDEPWGLDIVLYSGCHAAMAFEYGESAFGLSFLDISSAYKTVGDGKLFMSSASTAPHVKSITIPSILLRAVSTILRKVSCRDVVECFC